MAAVTTTQQQQMQNQVVQSASVAVIGAPPAPVNSRYMNKRATLKSAGNARAMRKPTTLGLTHTNTENPALESLSNGNVRTIAGTSSGFNAAGNPLRMIKEYKSHNQQNKQLGIHAKNSYSQFGGSNASTGEYFIAPNDEAERINQIMQEPIENLLSNMD